MRIEFSKKAIKFLDKITEAEKEKIRKKLKFLVESVENDGYLPQKELSIKKLRGKWHPKKRMKVGKIRIIFDIDYSSKKIKIYAVDNRGDIYK